MSSAEEILNKRTKPQFMDALLLLRQDIAASPGAAMQDSTQSAGIMQMITEPCQNTTRILERIDTMQTEIHLLTRTSQQLKNAIDDHTNEIHALKEENATLRETLAHQQNFLESVAADERQRRAVMLGVSEEPDALGQDDQAKVTKVFSIINPNNPQLLPK